MREGQTSRSDSGYVDDTDVRPASGPSGRSMHPGQEEAIRILIVEDDPTVRSVLASVLEGRGYSAALASSAEQALALLQEDRDFAAAIVDLVLGGMDGLSLIRRIRALVPDTYVLAVSGHATADVAAEAIRAGAFDFLTKPFEAVDVLRTVGESLRDRARALREVSVVPSPVEGDVLLGESPVMMEVFRTLGRISSARGHVVITGGTGTGRTLTARAVHRFSVERNGPFLVVECENRADGGAVELFGSGAEGPIGKLERAVGGTLLLRHVEQLLPELQQALLARVLEADEQGAGDFPRLVAVLPAGLPPPSLMPDLYYSLSVFRINLPPLRERREDIPLLSDYFRRYFNYQLGRAVRYFSPDVLEALSEYDWPGNVKELRNTVEQVIAHSKGLRATAADLPEEIRASPAGDSEIFQERVSLKSMLSEAIAAGIKKPMEKVLQRLRRMLADEALHAAAGDYARAAEMLGTTRQALRRILEGNGRKGDGNRREN